MARRPRSPIATAPSAEAPSAVVASVQDEGVPPPLQEILERMPPEPGVYLMKDKKGRVIYVGKAQSLRSRVRSYFSRSGDDRAFVRLLGRLVGDIETVVTNNEKEALLLENTLIKQHRPRFNVKLVDDKNFLVLRLDQRADYPRLEVVRRMRDDGARYFGPYHSAASCRQTLQVVNRHFKLRTCTDQVMRGRRRPCLQYQIKRCDAPCVFPVPRDGYAEQVRDVALFLDGKDQELVARLRERMMQASERTDFEVAAALRDQLRALERTLEEQRVISAQFLDQDVFGRHREGDVLTIAILHVRQGKLLGRRSYHFSGQEFPDEESVSAFVGLYYDMGNIIPDEVLLPVDIEDREAKQEWLRERAGEGRRRRRVEVLTPRRGPRARLVELANKNAQAAYHTRRDKRRDTQDALEKLQRRLGLKRHPRRIECFDISHLQGRFPVASMVVFQDGEPLRSAYRTFKVQSVENDDFAAVYEVLSRRLRRAKEALEAEAREGLAAPADAAMAAEAAPAYGPAAAWRDAPGSRPDPLEAAAGARGQVTEHRRGQRGGQQPPPAPLEPSDGDEEAPRDGWALPDLIVIDGGKGQLASAMAALRDTGLDPQLLDIIALAKERELGGQDDDDELPREPDRVFLPKVKDPLRLRPNTAELFILSRIRDEAHRFAVAFHGRRRQKAMLRSQLEDIPGVGARRRQALLKALGSVKRIRQATLEELMAVEGMTRKAAEAVRRFFQAVDGGADTGASTPTSACATPTPTPTDESVAENAAERELQQLGEEPDLLDEKVQQLVAEASLRDGDVPSDSDPA